jgi:2-methylcitrate dehydratase PrpD
LLVSEELASFISSFDGSTLLPGVLTKATTGIIDGLAVIIAGANDETGLIVHRALERAGQLRGETTIVGTDLKAGMLDAATCNGVAAHAHDYDDVLQGHTTHPTTHILPPLLAIAEAQPVTGRDFLAAYIVGLEVELGLAMAMGRTHYNAGFHSTGTLGALGATAAAARLLELDETSTLNAIAIACSSASGLRVNNGSPVKPLHAGHAARTGLEAAILAAEGFHGSPDALYGRFGYVQAYQGMLADEPRRWDTEDAREGTAVDWLSFKPFPCCGEATAAVEASLEIRRSIPVGEIERVAVTVCPLGREVLPFDLPQTPDQARFSAPYCVAVALHDGDLRLVDFTPDAIERQHVAHLIGRTTVAVDPGLADPGAVVEVWAKDGRTMTREVIVPTGNNKRGMPREVELAKFIQCTAGIFSPESARARFEQIERIDELKDVGSLVRSLVPPRGHSDF